MTRDDVLRRQRAVNFSGCPCSGCVARRTPRSCTHEGCWQSWHDAGRRGPVQCEEPRLRGSHVADPCENSCEHGWSNDNRRGCTECAVERADWLADDRRENG